MDGKKPTETVNVNENGKNSSTVRSVMRRDYKVKHSLPLDIFAGVISIILATVIWFLLG